jgi:hypothetical protein
LEERSIEWRVLASGERLLAGMAVNELSAKLRCFKNRHFEAGRMPIASKLEELPRGWCQESDRLECELPEPERRTL